MENSNTTNSTKNHNQTLKMKTMTILDRELERVVQYNIETKDYITFLQDQGHRLKYCEWMVHDNPIIFNINER